MKTALFIVLLLVPLIRAIPVERNISDVEIILDQESNDQIVLCEHDEPKTILSDLKGLLRSVLTDTIQPYSELQKIKCRNRTIESLHGVVFHEGGKRPELLQHGGIIDVRETPSVPR